MKNLLLVFLLIFAGAVLTQCQSTSNESSLKTSLDNVNSLDLGVVTKSEIEKKFGSPDEAEDDRWVYHEGSAPKLWLFFKGDRLTMVSWSIWEQDSVNDIDSLLNKITGSWKVIKEPMSNPHSAPSLCYLEDLAKGRRVEVSGYKKAANEITFWKPSNDDESIEHHLLKKVGKEFCIAGHCSKISDPGAWEHNHCEWLEKIVAKNKKFGENKKSKKPSKNKDL